MPSRHRTKLPVAFGEYFQPTAGIDAVDWSVLHARLGIVRAIGTQDFGLLEDLEHRLARSDPRSGPDVLGEWSKHWRIPDTLLGLGVVNEQWGNWAGDQWLDRQECQSIESWQAVSTSTPLVYVPVNLQGFPSEDFHLTVDGCDLTQSTLADWVQIVRAQFDAALEAHLCKVRTRAIAQQLSVSRAGCGTGNQATRYRWFVRFHFLEQTYAEIAGDVPLNQRVVGADADASQRASSQAVAEGVRTVAEAARIDLRSNGRRGRPRRVDRR
jgi:hypothetical protein